MNWLESLLNERRKFDQQALSAKTAENGTCDDYALSFYADGNNTPVYARVSNTINYKDLTQVTMQVNNNLYSDGNE